MSTRKAIADFWGGVAKTAQIMARAFGYLWRTTEAACKAMEALAVHARSRSTGLPMGAELVGNSWVDIPKLPVARLAAASSPPPLPPAAFKARLAAADEEERHWQNLIAEAKSQNERPAEAVSEDWGAVILAAKRRDGDRPAARLLRSRPLPASRSPQKIMTADGAGRHDVPARRASPP